MTLYNVGIKTLEDNHKCILTICEWEIKGEEAELVSITNKEDTKSYTMTTQIVDGFPVIYGLGCKRPLVTFQAVWLTRRAIPVAR